MKKNKIIPFSLLFITLTFLELFCIVKYSDVFYFPLAVGATLLGSSYLLLSEIANTVKSFIKERDEKANEINTNEAALAEKEEAAKLAKATYVLEKRILNLLEERILMPEENVENLSSLQAEVIRAIKASIKYDIKNTNHIADVITDNSVAQADLAQILSKFDALALEIKSNQLTMNAVKEQLQTITDIARQISNNRIQYASPVTQVSDSIAANNVSVSENTAGEYTEPVSKAMPSDVITEAAHTGTEAIYSEKISAEPTVQENAPIIEDEILKTEEIVPETDETLTNAGSEVIAEDTAESVDTLTAAEPVVDEPVPATAPAADDPNKKMSPDDIAALFAAASPEPEPVADEPVPATAPVADDPNKKMSPDDIAALFAASSPEPEPVAEEPVPATTPVAEDPNKKMSPEDIAALFASASLALEPEQSAPAPKTAIEALSKPAPAVTPVSDDPNKKMSPEDIAALFASAGQ